MGACRAGFIVGGLAALLSTGTAHAYSSYPGLVPNGSVYRCTNCHLRSSGGGARNAFGEQVRLNRRGGIPDWPVLFALDADNDGFTNGEELGDPCGCWVRGATPAFTDGISNAGDSTSTLAEPRACTTTCGLPDAGQGVASSSSSSSSGASASSSSGGDVPDPPGCGGGQHLAVPPRSGSGGAWMVALAMVVAVRRWGGVGDDRWLDMGDASRRDRVERRRTPAGPHGHAAE